jgi:hypothetical protein
MLTIHYVKLCVMIHWVFIIFFKIFFFIFIIVALDNLQELLNLSTLVQ